MNNRKRAITAGILIVALIIGIALAVFVDVFVAAAFVVSLLIVVGKKNNIPAKSGDRRELDVELVTMVLPVIDNRDNCNVEVKSRIILSKYGQHTTTSTVLS